jgi:hypothetical protein
VKFDTTSTLGEVRNMIRYRRIILSVVLIVIIGVWGYFTYNINKSYPNPKNISVRQGEEFKYKGADITVDEMNVYTFDELIKKYPELQTAYDVMGEDGENQKKEAKKFNYFVSIMNVKNNQSKTINFGKESIPNWVMEISPYANGMDFFYFQTLNEGYTKVLDSGEMEQVILCYGILDEYVSIEKMRSSDIKLVYSYYPTKNYVLRKGGE